MEKVMSEFKAGKLKSGGDKTVTKRKQAIAIGLAMEQKAHRKKPKKAQNNENFILHDLRIIAMDSSTTMGR